MGVIKNLAYAAINIRCLFNPKSNEKSAKIRNGFTNSKLTAKT